MIVGHHLIWTTYGYWLPNDPRGSTSKSIRNAKITGLGELHYGRKRIQPSGRELNSFREAAQEVLQHKLLNFSPTEITAIASSFAEVIRKHQYTCYACALMPDHVHILLRKHRDDAGTMIEHLQDKSRTAVLELNEREADHPVWGGPGWKVYLESRDDVNRTVRYIEQNPVKAGLNSRQFPFVAEYDGWLPGKIRVVRKQPKS